MIEVRDKEGRIYEFAVQTELSRTIGIARLEQDYSKIETYEGLYTKVTTISPQYVIVNNTQLPLLLC